MSELIRCDKCKKEMIKFKKETEMKKVNELFTLQIGERHGLFSQPIASFDLCNECYIKLKKFLESEV